jgi:hypothetical protein
MGVSWSELETKAPELAAAGHHRLYRYGPGLAFLATVRKDGGPRVHPVCPTIVDGRLWVLVGPSLKQHDLRRDARFALHTFPDADLDDEFYITGIARADDDEAMRARVRADNASRGASSGDEDALFELTLDTVMHAKYEYRGQWPPQYTKWRAEG